MYKYTKLEGNMSVPKEIREVERPKNTIVQENKSKKGIIYSVRKRNGYKINEKGKPCPINSSVIGHIIDNKYVPIEDSKDDNLPEKLSFGVECFIKFVSDDIYDDLLKHFDYKDATTILVIAMLRVIEPEITCNRLASEYSTSYLSAYYPGVALSKNHICDFIEKIGKNSRRITKFFNERLKRVEKEHLILIDGTLIQDNSSLNDLSAFSYKFMSNEVKDSSLIYAYDAELKEPICGQVFPENMLDASVFLKFIENNNFTKGILVDDKGFSISKIEKYLKETERNNLHFISPIKRSDSRIGTNEMYDWEGFLKNTDKSIKFKKAKIQENKWLYSFKDIKLAEEEEEAFNKKYKRNDKIPTKAEMDKCGLESGTITFVSDLDLIPEDVYQFYDNRWELETVFKTFKLDLCFTKTNIQNNFSVEGNQFINFISSLITCRLINKIKKADLFDTYSFNSLMKVLSKMWRKVDIKEGYIKPAPEPKRNDKYWAVDFKYIYDIMENLGLLS